MALKKVVITNPGVFAALAMAHYMSDRYEEDNVAYLKATDRLQEAQVDLAIAQRTSTADAAEAESSSDGGGLAIALLLLALGTLSLVSSRRRW